MNWIHTKAAFFVFRSSQWIGGHIMDTHAWILILHQSLHNPSSLSQTHTHTQTYIHTYTHTNVCRGLQPSKRCVTPRHWQPVRQAGDKRLLFYSHPLSCQLCWTEQMPADFVKSIRLPALLDRANACSLTHIPSLASFVGLKSVPSTFSALLDKNCS
jgi:hypothetical protein